MRWLRQIGYVFIGFAWSALIMLSFAVGVGFFIGIPVLGGIKYGQTDNIAYVGLGLMPFVITFVGYRFFKKRGERARSEIAPPTHH